jgi:DNA-binding NarL/FixJ family response regulator
MTPVGKDTALLITGSSNLAVGLRALLLSVPPIKQVERVGGIAELLERVAERRPALVVLDSAAMGDRLAEVLPALNHLSPKTRRLILSDQVAEMRALSAGGSETVIIKGTHPDRLATAVEALLGRN